MAVEEIKLEPEDCLWPLTTLRDTLKSSGSSLPSPKLRAIFTFHLSILKTPWRRARSGAKDSPNALSSSSISPISGIHIEIDEEVKRLAVWLASEAGIAALDAALIVKSYLTFSSYATGAQDQEKGKGKENEDRREGIIEEQKHRLLGWYYKECLALPEIVLEVLRLSREDNDNEWVDLARDIREGMGPDPSEYIENVFRGWAGLAQKNLEEIQRQNQPLLWSSFQLLLQSLLLDILFLSLYQTPERPASTSIGLIKGFIMSSFGTSQANREIWELDQDCQKISTRIRDLSLIITIESLGLASIVTPADPDAVEDLNTNSLDDRTLLKSKDSVLTLHLFLNDQSADLSPSPQTPDGIIESGEGISYWPMSVVCLGWAICLNSLRDSLLPPNPGYEGNVTAEMLSRAMRSQSGLFPWMEEILAGSLIRSTPPSDENDQSSNPSETYRRKVLKDLLIGLLELSPSSTSKSKGRLIPIWSSLYSTGSSGTSLTLSADYWVADHPIPDRRSLLDHSNFPQNPASLPNLLSALSGLSSSHGKTAQVYEIQPSRLAAQYFSAIPYIAMPNKLGWTRFVGKDQDGRMIIEANRHLYLPGGLVIHMGSQGIVINELDGKQLIEWETSISGFGLLVEILRTALGLRGMDEIDLVGNSDAVALSVGDLGIQQPTSDVLAAGVTFLSTMLRPIGRIYNDVISLIPTKGDHPVLILLEISIRVLDQYINLQSHTLSDHNSATSALDLLGSLTRIYPKQSFQALKSTGFFLSAGTGNSAKRKGIASHLTTSDSEGGEHVVSMALLELIKIMVIISLNTDYGDETVMKSALNQIYHDMWTTYSGWRYNDPIRKFELATKLCGVFNLVVSHPYQVDGTLSLAAQTVIDLLFDSASVITYRPLIDIFFQSPALSYTLSNTYQDSNALIVTKSVACASTLLGNVLNLHEKTKSTSSAPISIFSSNTSLAGIKMTLVDALFCIVVSGDATELNRTSILGLLRTYLDVSSSGQNKLGLTPLLRDTGAICSSLASIAALDGSTEQKVAIWSLLSSLVRSQAGCSSFVIGYKDGMAMVLQVAILQITNCEDFIDTPSSLAAVLAFMSIAFTSPSIDYVLPTLRQNKDLWNAIFNLATLQIPTPPSFTLSLHDSDFSAQILNYAYLTRCKANAISILSADLSLLAEDNDEHSTSESLERLLGIWRNGEKLSELVGAAAHNSVEPSLHVKEQKRLELVGCKIGKWKSVTPESRSTYGPGYIYEAGEASSLDPEHQSMLKLSFEQLNLNWSMIDSNLSLTRSFRSISEIMSTWVEGDPLSSTASLRASVILSELSAEEIRVGDVMLGIQIERLEILANLLQIALGEAEQVDKGLLGVLAVCMKAVLENGSFDPLQSLRHTGISPIHKPILRILAVVLEYLNQTGNTQNLDFMKQAGSFIIEASDLIFDKISTSGDTESMQNVGLVIGPLCELTKFDSGIWLDKLSESNLIMRSLSLVNKSRISKAGMVPPYLQSILLFHLALANQPSSAEKLAVSGILPTYCDNSISAQAENGKIVSNDTNPHSVGSTWCSILNVIRTVIMTLPNSANFVISDVIPFIRLTINQVLNTLTSWNGDDEISKPLLDEIAAISQLFSAIAWSLGSNVGLLEDISTGFIPLLNSIRHALSHPRLLSSDIVASSPEERSDLVRELEIIDKDNSDNVNLVNFERTPILAGRVYDIIKITRDVMAALSGLSGAWGLMTGTLDVQGNLIIHNQDEDNQTISASSDPIGLFNDISSIASNIAEQASSSTDDGAQLLRTCHQLAESCSLLSASQLLLRRSRLLKLNSENGSAVTEKEDVEMQIDEKKSLRRRSGSTGTLGRRDGTGGRSLELSVLREVESDWRGIINGDGAIGDNALSRWLEEGLDRAFDEEE